MWINKWIMIIDQYGKLDKAYVTYYDYQNERIYYTYHLTLPRFDRHCDRDSNKEYDKNLFQFIFKTLKIQIVNRKQLAFELEFE